MKLVKTVCIKAPRAHVWKFLVEAGRLAEWFHRGAADLAAGGDWVLLSNSPGKEGERLCWGKVLEFEPPVRLVHSFTHAELAGVETTCTWELAEIAGGTVITLTHDGFEQLGAGTIASACDHDAGWDEHFVRLRRVAG